MQKTELKKIRAENPEELAKSIQGKKLEIARILAKISSGQEKNLKKAKNLKRDLAQVLTVIKEVEIVQKLQKVEKVVKVAKPKK